MKRMNLKKAISLLTFVAIMFLSLNTVSAQAEDQIKLKNHYATIGEISLDVNAQQAQTSINQKDLKKVMIKTIVKLMDEGQTSSDAIEAAFAGVANLPQSSRTTMMLVVKQEIYAILN